MMNDDYYNMKWFRVQTLVGTACVLKNVMTMGTNEKSKITSINHSYLGWTILSTHHNALGAS